MKSIIEQASSIMKAIEKAWNQAENPKEFSIKIFEKEEKNFFGMTTKSAKIGIFFGDKPIIHEKPAQKPRQEIKECRPTPAKPVANKSVEKTEEHRSPVSQPSQKPSSAPTAKAMDNKPENKQVAQQRKTPTPHSTTNQQTRSHIAQEKTPSTHAVSTQEKPRRTPTAWNDTMIASAHNWLKKTLELLNMNSIQFNSEVVGKNLKITFNMPLVADAMHEKQLFRSFAHLIISSLRNQYKQEIKDLKVIFLTPTP